MNNIKIVTIKEWLEMQSISNILRNEGKSIALVPTMGALHEGHLSLVEEACRRADIAVVSIFVNPSQFGPNEDYDKYIRDYEGDLKKLAKYDVKYVFHPRVEDVYNEGFQTQVEVKELQKSLCGVNRPGHFKGVTTIVLKLFNIVKPHFAIFGEKDYQQYKIVQKMVKDLNVDVKIVSMPIFREKDGLAMSSRNKYLSTTEREKARYIYITLSEVKSFFEKGYTNCSYLINSSKNVLNMKGINDIDYFEIRDSETLEIRKEARKGDLVAIAVNIGGTRLIDNVII